MFFQKKKVLKAVANGQIIPLSEVNDEVFSAKMMGAGFAIKDHDGRIHAPISGKIESVFPTLHAITIKGNNGVMVLVHMGLDTVDLKGEPFDLLVHQGDLVSEGQEIARMDLKLLTEKNKDSTVIVVLPDVENGTVTESATSSISDIAFKF